MKRLFLLLLIHLNVNAKLVYIDIYNETGQEIIREVYTCDPELEVWKLRNYVFKEYNIDERKFALVEFGLEGAKKISLKSALKNYGDTANSSVLLHVFPLHFKGIKSPTKTLLNPVKSLSQQSEAIQDTPLRKNKNSEEKKVDVANAKISKKKLS
jgi:hypothetical protein